MFWDFHSTNINFSGGDKNKFLLCLMQRNSTDRGLVTSSKSLLSCYRNQSPASIAPSKADQNAPAVRLVQSSHMLIENLPKHILSGRLFRHFAKFILLPFLSQPTCSVTIVKTFFFFSLQLGIQYFLWYRARERQDLPSNSKILFSASPTQDSNLFASCCANPFTNQIPFVIQICRLTLPPTFHAQLQRKKVRNCSSKLAAAWPQCTFCSIQHCRFLPPSVALALIVIFKAKQTLKVWRLFITNKVFF